MGVFCGDERLNQIQFRSSFYSSSTISDVEFAVNSLGMGAHGTQGHDQFTGDFWAGQFGGE